MKLLLIADEEDKSLWDHYRPEKLEGVDLILSAGDLKPEYLSFLVTMKNRPLLYVHGNHDGVYERRPPEGCDCIDDDVVNVMGLRIMGLGGCMGCGDAYRLNEKQMRKRIRRLRFKLWRSKGVDIILTHAPAKGYGDMDDLMHNGFECFLELIDKYQPKLFIHGHIHSRYGHDMQRVYKRGETTIINASGKYILDLPQR